MENEIGEIEQEDKKELECKEKTFSIKPALVLHSCSCSFSASVMKNKVSVYRSKKIVGVWSVRVKKKFTLLFFDIDFNFSSF